MYILIPTTRFKRDLKKSKADFSEIRKVLKILENDGVKGIHKRMKPHFLKGKYSNNWECHVKPDLLIIWIQHEEQKEIKLVRIGSHSDLFK